MVNAMKKTFTPLDASINKQNHYTCSETHGGGVGRSPLDNLRNTYSKNIYKQYFLKNNAQLQVQKSKKLWIVEFGASKIMKY